jgi:tetratricopeptide (TPR) repeat protein
MFRRLTAALRHWGSTLRRWYYVVRIGLSEWRGILTAPVRLFRPRQLGSEMVTGGREALGLVRGFFGFLAGLVTGFVGLIVRAPRYAVYGCVRGPRRLWLTLRSWTPRQLLYVGSVSAATLVAVGGSGWYLLQERRLEGRRANYWRQYEAYLAGSDVEKLESTLAALQKVSPADATLGPIAEAVRNRQAPASDPKLVRFVARVLLREQQLDKAAAEARKILDTIPDDWEAHYILAEDAARRGDRAGAVQQLAALPRALDVADSIPPYVVLQAAQLCQRLGESARHDELVEFIVLNLLPILKNKDLPHTEPAFKLFLVQAYFQALTQLDRRPRLTQYWVPVQQACRMVQEDKALGVPALVELGLCQQQNLLVLQEFLRRKLISEDEAKGMATEVQARLKAVWEVVLERESNNPQGFIGLAYHKLGTGAAREAVQTAARGLEVCGPRPELVEAMANLLQLTDPQAGLAFLEQTLRDSDLTPRMCQVYADVARRAGRRDKALVACRRALRQDPGLLWARRGAGEVCMELGRPTEAAALLGPAKAELAKDPAGCALYVRALCDCGSYQLADEFLEQVTAENRPAEVLLKAAQGMQAANRHADAVRWAKRVLEKDTLNVEALLVVGDSLRVLAEEGDRGWDREKAREAITAYRAVQRQDPKNLTAVNNLVWLELKALERPQEAYESAAPLRAVQHEVGTPADFLETLGAVYIGVGQYDLARQMLQQAVATAGPRASFLMHLALAHHGLKQPEMAEYFLQRAAEQPKSAREVAELYDAGKVINRK